MKKNKLIKKIVAINLYIIFIVISFSKITSGIVFPGADWEERTPESQGVDSAKLNEALNYLKSKSGSYGIREVVVIRNGYMIWKGNNIDNQHSTWSVG